MNPTTITTERRRLDSCRPGSDPITERLGTHTKVHKGHLRIPHNMHLVDAPRGPNRTQPNRTSDMFRMEPRYDVFLECDVRKAFLILVAL